MALVYDSIVSLLWCLIHVFFRLNVRGQHFVPRKGPVLFVAAPHSNQFIDPCILQATSGRRIGFLAAAKSMRKRFIGFMARILNSIPVERPQDLAKMGVGRVFWRITDSVLIGCDTKFRTEIQPGDTITVGGRDGLIVTVVEDHETIRVKIPPPSDFPSTPETANTYKIFPKVDQSQMFSQVTKRFKEGRCVGIFPEGGSHDRTELLPLKAGAAIMVLGAMAEHRELDVPIIPVGMNYFHAEKFRSRAVVEYGPSIKIEPRWLEGFTKGGDAKRQAIQEVMRCIEDRLRELTLTAPDFETLSVIQTTRRLYAPKNKVLSPGESLAIARRVAVGYEKMKDDPRIQAIRARVVEYNQLLCHFAMSDHQVKKLTPSPFRAAFRLFSQLVIFICTFSLCAPGLILFYPISWTAKYVARYKAHEALMGSQVKISGKDVMATWKMLTAVVVLPVCFSTYTIAVHLLLRNWSLTLLFFFGLPVGFLFTLIVSEVAFESGLRLYPLCLSVLRRGQITEARRILSRDIQDLINELGPQVLPDFERIRVVKKGELDGVTWSLDESELLAELFE